MVALRLVAVILALLLYSNTVSADAYTQVTKWVWKGAVKTVPKAAPKIAPKTALEHRWAAHKGMRHPEAPKAAGRELQKAEVPEEKKLTFREGAKEIGKEVVKKGAEPCVKNLKLPSPSDGCEARKEQKPPRRAEPNKTAAKD